MPRALLDALPRWRKPGRLVRDLEVVGLLAGIAVASSLLLLPRGDSGLIGLPELRAGEVAPRTVKSPRAFSVLDPVATTQTRERARDAVRPVFDHLLGITGEPAQRLARALEAANAASSAEAGEVFEASLGIEVEPEQAAAIVRTSQPEAVVDAASMLLEAVSSKQLTPDPALPSAYPAITVRTIDPDGKVTSERQLSGLELGEVLGPNQARAEVDALAADRLGHLPSRLRHSVAKIVKELLTPNFVPNAQETLRRRKTAWELAKPSMILVGRGERIVRGGERVTERDLSLLRALAALESPRARFQSMLGSGLLGTLLAWLGYRSARYAYRHRLPKKRDLVFLASAFGAYLLCVWLGFKMVEWLTWVDPVHEIPRQGYRLILPMAAVGIVVRLSAGPVAAAAAAPVFGFLSGWMMDGDLDFAAYAFAGAFAAASTEPGAKRIVLAAGIRAGIAQAVVAISAPLLAAELEPAQALVLVALALVSGLVSSLIARVTLPAVEAIFGYTTPTGLAAFADFEHPLLRELLLEVPGTYHHSLQVGALAEAGARSIGSDRLLARVGGSLHDVGRLGGALPPEERRRVASRLAGEHRFPPELAQILAEQPHEAGRAPEPSARRPKPRSKTAALVALADQVEDALRGREGEMESRGALEREVSAEVRAAMARGILDEAALELRELAAVAVAFAEALGPRFVPDAPRPVVVNAPPSPGAPS